MADVTEMLLRDLSRYATHDAHDSRVRVGVAGRADGRCEYCLMPTGGQFQVDHIIPPQQWARFAAGLIHGIPPIADRRGPQHLDNFAWCCPFCNQAKSHRITSSRGRGATRLFDPRYDDWREHFAFVFRYVYILGITEIGEATMKALDFNDRRKMNHVGPRHVAIMNDDYPPEWARDLLIPG